MDNNYKQLDYRDKHKDAVLYFSNANLKPMFKADDFASVIKNAFQNKGYQGLGESLNPRGGVPGTSKELFDTGLHCEILEPNGKGWKKGKVRIKITLEFCSDEPEIVEPVEKNNKLASPLDEIRHSYLDSGS